MVIVKDNGKHLSLIPLGLSWTTPNTRFLLLSYYQLDSKILTNLEDKIKETIQKGLVGFNIINTGVEFRNIRFEGKQPIHYI